MTNKLLIVNQSISLIAILIMAILFYGLSSEPKIAGVLFFIPFTGSPVFINQIASLIFRTKKAGIISICALFLYLIWFAFVYMTLVHWTSDAQNAIGFLFVGIYSLPIMLIFWIAELIVWIKEKNANKIASGDSEQRCDLSNI